MASCDGIGPGERSSAETGEAGDQGRGKRKLIHFQYTAWKIMYNSKDSNQRLSLGPPLLQLLLLCASLPLSSPRVSPSRELWSAGTPPCQTPRMPPDVSPSNTVGTIIIMSYRDVKLLLDPEKLPRHVRKPLLPSPRSVLLSFTSSPSPPLILSLSSSVLRPPPRTTSSQRGLPLGGLQMANCPPRHGSCRCRRRSRSPELSAWAEFLVVHERSVRLRGV